jgi:hypothetical protein
MLLRALIVWLLIAGIEILQGILRVRLLNRRVGDHRARQIGVGTGSAAILLVAWFAVPWIGAQTLGELLGTGFLWLVLMLALDVGFGCWVFRMPWKRIAEDFDLRRGRLLAVGMLILFLAPLLVAWLRAV